MEPGIYNFDAIAYESVMIGFYSVWQGPENRVCDSLGIQKRNEISLGYSRDGFHFSRPTHEPFMKVNHAKESWNWGNMQSVCGVPIIVGDSLYFYASGRRLNEIHWDSHSSTGLATLRRDGFVSMSSDIKEGYLKTEKLQFDGKYLFVNCETTGYIKVEILDEKDIPIPGFTKEDCISFIGDKTKHQITWQKKKDVSELDGKIIRLKFYLSHGNLYSFWISPWKTGESRGYTAGGGPGLNGSGLDIH